MTNWIHLKNRLACYLIVSITISQHTLASDINHFFESSDSTKYSNIDNKSNNRQDDDPIVYIKSFDLSRLTVQRPHEISESVIQALIANDLSENNHKYTIDRLHNLSEQLTKYYRSKGYILSKVFFPEQDVKNQTLYLDVVYGKLEKVSTHKEDHYSESRLTKPFQSLIGEATHISSLESSLLELNQYPGVSVKSRFRPGDELGNTQIDIFVTEEKISDYNLSIDNYGSKYTGSTRGMLTADLYNIADMADRLSLNILATVNPANSLFLGTNYSFRWSPYFNSPSLNALFRHGIITQIGYQESQYTVGGEFELANIEGKANSTFLGISKDFLLRNQLKINGGLTLTKKQAISYQNDQPQIEEKISIITTTSSLQWTDHLGSPSASAIQLQIHKGLPGFAGAYNNNDEKIGRTGSSNNKAPMDFTKYNLQLMRNQNVGPYQLLGKISIQHTDDLLMSSELSNLGGATSVRGYSSSDFSGDKSLIASLEISGKSNATKFVLPISNLKLAAFLDYGKGKRLEPNLDVMGEAEMMSAGCYAQFLKEGSFSSKIELAMPLKEVGESDKNKFEILFNFDRGF